MNLIPLYVKTGYSLLSSMIKIKELISFCKENGYNAITITDNNMYGAREFYQECLKQDIKPVIGLEIEVNNSILVLYAKNNKGYKSLIKLATLKTEKQLNLDDLNKYNTDLIAILPFTSQKLITELKNIYSDIFQGYSSLEEREKLKGNNLIYFNETLYLEKSDKKFISYLEAIRTGKEVDTNFKQTNYLLKLNELTKLYPHDLENNEKINDMCNLVMETNKSLLPKYKTPDNISAYDYLKKLCQTGLVTRFGKTVPKMYIERLKYELNIIKEMDFCNYFLVVWDYCKYAKELGILYGTRGSAAGSLVTYCLYINDVDPIKYNLLFERFLNPERITMPDIDIDFEDERRNEIIEYCFSKYGIKKVAQIITFGTLGAKQVTRDVAKVLKIEDNKTDKICKLLGNNLQSSIAENDKLNNLITNNPDLKKLFEIALKLEGLPRHTSLHAAGVVMAEKNLDEIIPLDKSHGDFYTTSYSMNYLEELGLLKMDFLGLKNLTTITNIIEAINKNEKKQLDFYNIPLNDKETFKIFKEANTEGIFQFESVGMKQFLKKLKPDSLEELFSAVALFRPGPMDNIDLYINRKYGKMKIDYLHPDLKPILESTYGVIIFQEQIMQIAHVLAGYSLGEADVLRRAMSKKKKEVLVNEKEKFISRSIEKGYQGELAEKVFTLILKFANYGFPRGHSVAYAIIAYKMAYLKYHYPKYFMSTLLSMVIGSETKTREYLLECNLNNIKILKPDINLSTDKYVVEDTGIRFSFAPIKNIGVMACQAILEERKKGYFTDFFDFAKRCYGKSVNIKALESLIDTGCFTDFGLNRQTITTNLDLILNYVDLARDIDESILDKPELEIVSEYEDNEIIRREYNVLGFYLSKHPLIQYKEDLNNNLSLNQLSSYLNKSVKVIVIIDSIKEIITKNNETMAFLTISDETGKLDATLFHRVYTIYSNIQEEDVTLIKGRVELRNEKIQLIVDEIKLLNKEVSKS